VSKGKLDPKLTINNRIRDLETSVKALQSLASAQRKALDAVPARIKSYIPTDLKSQMARLTNLLDRMESKGSNRSNPSVSARSGTVSAQNIEGKFNEDCLSSLVQDIKVKLNPIDTNQLQEKLLNFQLNEDQFNHLIKYILQDHVMKKVARRMIDNGYLDDLGSNEKSKRATASSSIDEEYEEMVKKQQTLAIIQEVTNKLMSKEDLILMFETALQPHSNLYQSTPTNTALINMTLSADSLIDSQSVIPPLTPTLSRSPSMSHDIVGKSIVGEMVHRAATSTENKQILSRLPSGSMSDPTPSNYNHRRKMSLLKGSTAVGDGPELNQLSEKFRHVISYHMQGMTSDLVRKQEMDEKFRNTQTLMNLEIMNLKKELFNEIVTEKVDGIITKQIKLEKQVNANITSINNFDAMMRIQMTEIERIKSMGRGATDRSWKPELDKMSKQLSQTLLTQKEFTEMVSPLCLFLTFLNISFHPALEGFGKSSSGYRESHR
jgi:hypothetical protein